MIAAGHNRRVQDGDPTAHGEMDCIRRAGRRPRYDGVTLYTTLSPCMMCAGTVVQFGVPRVVIGEDRNFPGNPDFLRAHSVEVRAARRPGVRRADGALHSRAAGAVGRGHRRSERGVASAPVSAAPATFSGANGELSGRCICPIVRVRSRCTRRSRRFAGRSRGSSPAEAPDSRREAGGFSRAAGGFSRKKGRLHEKKRRLLWKKQRILRKKGRILQEKGRLREKKGRLRPGQRRIHGSQGWIRRQQRLVSR